MKPADWIMLIQTLPPDYEVFCMYETGKLAVFNGLPTPVGICVPAGKVSFIPIEDEK